MSTQTKPKQIKREDTSKKTQKFYLKYALKIRQQILKNYIKILLIKSFLTNRNNKKFYSYNYHRIKILAQKQLQNSNHHSHISLARNLCFGTTKTSSHYRLFAINRM